METAWKKGDKFKLNASGLAVYPSKTGVYEVQSDKDAAGVYFNNNGKLDYVHVDYIERVNTTAVATVSDEEDPKYYIMQVQFSNDTKRTYEYLAFGTFDELCDATHAVVCGIDHTDIDSLLTEESLKIVRVMNVYPTSQQKFHGKLRHIVDFVEGHTFVERNMKKLRAEQLRVDLKKRMEELTQRKVLEEMVVKSGDATAMALLEELKGLDNV